MKQIIFLLVLVTSLISCGNKTENKSIFPFDEPPHICLQPLNGFSKKEAQQIAIKLENYLKKYDNYEFMGDCVYVDDNDNLSGSMLNSSKTRYRADKIINYYQDGAYYCNPIICLTNEDISTSLHGRKDWGVLGFSWKGKYVGIASTYRLKNPKRDYWKVVLHEFIHAFYDYGHCPKDDPKCIMQDAKGHANFSNKNDLCDYCKKHIYDHTAY